MGCAHTWEPDALLIGNVCAQDVADLCDAVIDRWAHPATPPAPQPPSYIDPEHQGDDRELLEAFYRASNGWGGTADENYLRGIRAVLAARPAAPAAPEVGEGPSVEQMYHWALKAIRQYGSDTLSGRADGGADGRQWQRAAVVEMVRRAQTALDYGNPAAPAVVAPISHAERLRIVKRGIVAGYNLGHHHTVEGGWGDPDAVSADHAPEILGELGIAPPAPEVVPSEEDLYDLADEFNGDPVPAMRAALSRWGRPAAPKICHAHRDGECHWEQCPQLRDGEPAATGRSCPLPLDPDDIEWAVLAARPTNYVPLKRGTPPATEDPPMPEPTPLSPAAVAS